jgi:type IV pilus assembly protein PilM
LARNDDIRSTEKLLQLIRHSDTQKSAPSAAKPKSGIAQPLTLSRRRTIGVDIGHTYIKMAKVERLSDKNYELLDYLDIPLSRPISFQDPALPGLLKQHLDRLRGQSGPCEIWSAITSSNVESRCIRIPKLPRKQIRNAVLWTFTQKVAINEQDELFDYEVLGEISEGGVKKTEVMAVKAPRAEINALQSAFEKAGYPLKGITISPFAIQNLFRRQLIPHSDQEVCSLFIGRDWSRIAIFRNGNLVLSRGIKAGIRSMVEAIHLALRPRDTWDSTGEDSQAVSSENGTDDSPPLQDAQRRFLDFLRLSSGSNPDSPPGSDPAETFQMVLPALERLVRQIERTLEHYALTFHGEGVRRLMIAGQITANPAIVNYLSQQLELPTGVMNPFASSAFSRQVKTPPSESERESFAPAIGLAVADNHSTPNFLYTHEDKDRFENIRRNNMRILITCMLCLMILIGVFSWQERQLDQRRDQYDKLNQQLLAYTPAADQKILLAMYAKTKQNRQTLHTIVHRYGPIAAMQELSDITPATIRLIGAEINRPPDTKGAGATQILTLDGLIFGNPGEFETSLTSYLFALNNSVLFRKPSVLSKRVEFYNAQEVLRFTAKLEML